jgi:hypothetical protein
VALSLGDGRYWNPFFSERMRTTRLPAATSTRAVLVTAQTSEAFHKQNVTLDAHLPQKHTPRFFCFKKATFSNILLVYFNFAPF